MYHNLTNKQLAALRWLVERIQDGDLEESFMPVPGGIFKIASYSEKIPDCLDFGSMEALIADDTFIKRGNYCIVTRHAFEIIAFDFANPHPDPIRTFIRETHRLILKSFNREELRQICFNLGINTDWVFGNKTDWPFELLLYLYQNDRLSELTPILQGERQNVDWPIYPG